MFRSLSWKCCHQRFHSSCRSLHKRPVSSKEIRSRFIEFFRSHDHVHVPSSSVVPSKNDGSYFVNAGMNQFKPIFLGTVDPGSDMAKLKRAVNSQKCIRVGGKHNDLEDVGKDLTHHTFFEMLGSWSFGDYFKREACVMAWELLTKCYHIPEEKLIVTYFGGSEDLGLKPDDECRNIWLSMGIPQSRIFPLGIRDNFWDMGDSGPCGPCTEIHLNASNADASKLHQLLIKGDPGVVELWNLVFMQFNRETDGTLRPLPQRHVDTGMGLERVAAVLQGVASNYDTDLFRPFFDLIQKECGCSPYRGMTGSSDAHGIDTAYRTIADHSRMLTVAMGDGLVPGRKGLDARVRHIMYRAFRHASILNAPKGLLAKTVPLVVDSLGEAFPELNAVPGKIQDVFLKTEERYREQLKQTEKSLKRVLNEKQARHLSNEDAQRIIQGQDGTATNPDLLSHCAQALGVSFDLDAFYNELEAQKPTETTQSSGQERCVLNQYHIEYLLQEGVSPTDDSFKYSVMSLDRPFETQFAKTSAILDSRGTFVKSAEEGDIVGIILNRTSFYSEGGGQAADCGEIKTVKGCRMKVIDVQKTRNYVLHSCQVLNGAISVGESVSLDVDQEFRHCCACNHTATHLLNFALRQVLGQEVWQAGSSVNGKRLVFEFRSLQTQISADEMKLISDEVNKCINEHLDVFRSVVHLAEIERHPQLVKLDQEVYPSEVSLISVGKPVDFTEDDFTERRSLELCGGTHVQNTADIGSFIISHFHGSGQGTKRVTALTGKSAKEGQKNGAQLLEDIDRLEEIVNSGGQQDWLVPLSDLIEKAFIDGRPLPKVLRDNLHARFERLKWKGIRRNHNKDKTKLLQEEMSFALASSAADSVVVHKLEMKTKMRDVMKQLAVLHTERNLTQPMVFLFTSSDTGQLQSILAVPKGSDLTGESWARALEGNVAVQNVKEAVNKKYKGKLDGLSVWSLIGQKSNSTLMDKAFDLSLRYLQSVS